MSFRSKHGKCATPNVIVKLHTTQDIYFLTVAAAFMPDIGDALGQLMMDKLMTTCDHGVLRLEGLIIHGILYPGKRLK